MKVAIVLTTINIPTVLEQYIENCQIYGHKDVYFIVIGDRKSPPEISKYIESLTNPHYDIIYLGIEDQEHWLRRFPQFSDFLPYDSVQRRNVGYLYASAELGTDIIISIDDDNIPLKDYDYVGNHSIVGNSIECDVVSSSTGWFNTCSLLKTEPVRRFYHRGFPISKRWLDEELSIRKTTKRVVVNVGLWLGDPDVDTITRLEEPFTVTGLKGPAAKILLDSGCFSPFNSQNTAFWSEILPCLYLIAFSPMKSYEILTGNNNFRYDDIWMSYFAKMLIDHMGDAVCIGPPHVEQQRNEHDYLLDLRKEIGPMELTDKLVRIFHKIELYEDSYFGAYEELIDGLSRNSLSNPIFDFDEQNLLSEMIKGMRLWLDAIAKIHSF